jgi:hypothetical protein
VCRADRRRGLLEHIGPASQQHLIEAPAAPPHPFVRTQAASRRRRVTPVDRCGSMWVERPSLVGRPGLHMTKALVGAELLPGPFVAARTGCPRRSEPGPSCVCAGQRGSGGETRTHDQRINSRPSAVQRVPSRAIGAGQRHAGVRRVPLRPPCTAAILRWILRCARPSGRTGRRSCAPQWTAGVRQRDHGATSPGNESGPASALRAGPLPGPTRDEPDARMTLKQNALSYPSGGLLVADTSALAHDVPRRRRLADPQAAPPWRHRHMRPPVVVLDDRSRPSPARSASGAKQRDQVHARGDGDRRSHRTGRRRESSRR